MVWTVWLLRVLCWFIICSPCCLLCGKPFNWCFAVRFSELIRHLLVYRGPSILLYRFNLRKNDAEFTKLRVMVSPQFLAPSVPLPKNKWVCGSVLDLTAMILKRYKYAICCSWNVQSKVTKTRFMPWCEHFIAIKIGWLEPFLHCRQHHLISSRQTKKIYKQRKYTDNPQARLS